MSTEHFDVVIMGAGLSGIGAGYRLQTKCPAQSYAILEARPEIGGTWDLFRYPGVRSDSDMFTLGYPFRPWKDAKAIADGPAILKYIRETARECGIDRHIRFRQRVISAAWSSQDARWMLDVQAGENGETVRYTCNFLYGCTGYYRYDAGYQPDFPGAENFRGRFLHPQHWPENLDYSGKRVVVIGSGATAVTLVPAMAETAGHVTMLQRSPSYILSIPAVDRIAGWLRRVLPEGPAHRILRWKNILVSMVLYQLSRRKPQFMRGLFRKIAAGNLPAGYDVDTHFKPKYEPWDQRLCLVPDSDLFKAIRGGRASVATGEIETFTERGIRLRSGEELEADIIISATGLRMVALGGVKLTVDGAAVEPGKTFIYKGVMLGNIPNFAFCVGYTNASWTLRADLSSTFVCRVLNHMKRHGYRVCRPECDPEGLEVKPLLGLNSGYVLRAAADLPKQAGKKPWIMRQNYILDMLTMRLGSLEDGVLKFTRAVAARSAEIREAIPAD
ncbi:MAG TPA: NAD(P)/FAD-dependent oxidoreductase [Candidatus Acidoferrales bacterium]|nr:NAD(P)/FAD-dependent oxidoreductase [Candidatus Acidoferrales bacterium]